MHISTPLLTTNSNNQDSDNEWMTLSNYPLSEQTLFCIFSDATACLPPWIPLQNEANADERDKKKKVGGVYLRWTKLLLWLSYEK